jgi:hypothetical protein
MLTTNYADNLVKQLQDTHHSINQNLKMASDCMKACYMTSSPTQLISKTVTKSGSTTLPSTQESHPSCIQVGKANTM